jgi:hypothetical protein
MYPRLNIDRAVGPGVYLWSPAPDRFVAVFATSTSSTHEKMDDAAVKYLVVGKYSTCGKNRLCEDWFGLVKLDQFLMPPKTKHSDLRVQNYMVSKWPHTSNNSLEVFLIFFSHGLPVCIIVNGNNKVFLFNTFKSTSRHRTCRHMSASIQYAHLQLCNITSIYIYTSWPKLCSYT